MNSLSQLERTERSHHIFDLQTKNDDHLPSSPDHHLCATSWVHHGHISHRELVRNGLSGLDHRNYRPHWLVAASGSYRMEQLLSFGICDKYTILLFPGPLSFRVLDGVPNGKYHRRLYGRDFGYLLSTVSLNKYQFMFVRNGSGD